MFFWFVVFFVFVFFYLIFKFSKILLVIYKDLKLKDCIDNVLEDNVLLFSYKKLKFEWDI